MLHRTALTDAGLDALTRAGWWATLTELDLTDTRLTDAGAAVLLRADVPAELAVIALDRRAFAGPVREALDAHFGDRLAWAGDAE